MSKGVGLFDELMRFRPEGLTANGWAVKAGVSRTIWTDLKRHGNPSRRTLEKLLGAAEMSLAEFEALRLGTAARETDGGLGLAEGYRGWRGAPLPHIPMFATELTGEWAEAGSGIDIHSIDRLRPVATIDRPKALAADGDAYAVTLAGEAMWPRFRAGRMLLVSPSAPVVIGDDVLVTLGAGRVLIKELAGRSARRIALRQFSPDKSFEVNPTDVVSVHKVVGEAL